MKRRRVKITGIGPVTPAGIGKDEFARGILMPTSRVRKFTKLDPDLGPFVAGFVDDFTVKDYVDSSRVTKGMARHSEFAIAGAVLALRDANITDEELRSVSAAVVTGSSLMDFGGIGRTIEGVVTKGLRGAVPRTVFTTTGASIAASVSDALGIRARTICIQTSCCAGLDAIGYAAQVIAEGQCSLAICGGTEAPLYRTPLVELRAVGLTPNSDEHPERMNRPFDRWRTTGVVSEGCAMFVLEPENSPRRAYGFIDGYGCVSDAGRWSCAGLEDSIVSAIANAGRRRSEIDSICSWGPGHIEIDAAEAATLRNVFGRQSQAIAAYSIKGCLGNPLGAAGAIQVAAAALSFELETIPPTVNWQFPDPACDLNLSNKPRTVGPTCTLIDAHGLSGVNSAVVLCKP